MLPILFSLGGLPVSSFGTFLLLSLLLTSFIIWRIIRIYDFDEERAIDLIILTFMGGLIFARLYFVAVNFSFFNDIFKIVLINKYPGLSFWGGLLGALITLRLFCYRLKFDFWQVADFAVVGGLAAMSLGSIGCLLGSCEYGQVTNSIFGVTQVGLIGKRFPLQILESLLFLLAFYYLWKQVLKFHFPGQIAAKGLIIIALIKLFIEPLRGDALRLFNVNVGIVWSIVLFVYGMLIYYRQTKRSFRSDIRFLVRSTYNSSARGLLVSKINKQWYNFRINLKITVSKWGRNLAKLLNVKSNPTKF